MDSKLIARVLRYLSIKPRTTSEVEKYLNSKFNISKEDISKILDYLRSSGFLDDEFIKNATIRSKTARGFGSRYIRQKLLSRGIRVKDDIKPDIDKIVCIVLRKYKPRESNEDESKLKAKVYRFLSYRGLEIDEINDVIRRVFKQDKAE